MKLLDGHLEDPRQIATGLAVTEQGSRLLELVDQRRAGRELDLESVDRQRRGPERRRRV